MFGLVLSACGVRGVDQDAHAVLLDHAAASPSTTDLVTVRDELLLGSVEREVDHRVPVLVEWTVATDAAGCRRVQTVKLTRSGGPTSTELYRAGAKPMHAECVSRSAGDAPEKFDAVSVAYCWRWNGAINTAECAYSGGFVINADKVGIEGIVDRPTKTP